MKNNEKPVKMKRIRHEGMVEKPTALGKVADIAIVLFMLLASFIFIIPLWHVIMSSFSDGKSLLANVGVVWTPIGEATLDGYKHLLRDNSIMKGYANTLIYVIGATFNGLLLATLGGYVLSRPTKLRMILTVSIILALMFNGGLVPTYMVIKKLGWVGKRMALLIPGCTNAMFIVMMMNGFLQVPESTVEAARIDGAGHLRTLYRVALPQAKSMATVLILNTVVMQWNAWFPASIYVATKRDLWPLQLWIRQIVADNASFILNQNPDYSRYLIQFSLIVVATIPLLVVMPFFQEQLEKGALGGAVKG